MGRIVPSLAMAFVLVGCVLTPRGEQVPLLTGALGCYAGGEGGPTAVLIAESQYGTSFSGHPVMWPTGYTAHRAGTEVEIVDGFGNLKATTGRTYHISQAATAGFTLSEDDGTEDDETIVRREPSNAFPAAVECTYEHDFIDCTAAPDNQWCTKP